MLLSSLQQFILFQLILKLQERSAAFFHVLEQGLKPLCVSFYDSKRINDFLRVFMAAKLKVEGFCVLGVLTSQRI